MNAPGPHRGRSLDEARLFETLLVGLAVVVISALVLRVVSNQQAFLDFYFVATAITSALIVMGTAFMNDETFSHPGSDAWVRWTDLGLWAGFLFLTANTVAWLAERDRAHVDEVRSVYTGVLEIMAKFIDSMDRSTANHSRRVAQRAIELGRELGMPESGIETLRVAAYLHDIGKVEVSTDVLQKAAALTAEERMEMERHVDYGTGLLQRLGGLLEDVVPLVMYHHERWDGHGYKGLAGTSIPLGARIIAVCDTYDAIVADRPYREGRSHGQAVEILQAGSGTQFDPAVVTAFLVLFHEDTPAGGVEPGEAVAA
jgi:putative nucleotidyltransferase with HDIG domain